MGEHATPFRRTVEFGHRCSCGSVTETLEDTEGREFTVCQQCDDLEDDRG